MLRFHHSVLVTLAFGSLSVAASTIAGAQTKALTPQHSAAHAIALTADEEGGATDGRCMRAVGIPMYGVSGIFSTPGETNAHGRDEKLRVKSYYDGLDFLYELVKQVAGPTGGRVVP